MILGHATRKFHLETDRNEDQIIFWTDKFATDYRGYGLDSMDLGDTMGFWMEYLSQEGENEVHYPDLFFRAYYEDELFEWEGINKNWSPVER